MRTGEKTEIKPITNEDRYLEAVRQNDIQAVRAALEAGADANARDGLGSSAFLLAARKTENLELLRFLRTQQNPAALDARDAGGRTPLSWAARGGSAPVLDYLLDEGAALELADRDDRSPLFHAVMAGEAGALRILLKAGADVNRPDRFGDTPLMMAAMKGRTNIVRILLAAGADPERKNQEGQTARNRVRDANMRRLLAAGR